MMKVFAKFEVLQDLKWRELCCYGWQSDRDVGSGYTRIIEMDMSEVCQKMGATVHLQYLLTNCP